MRGWGISRHGEELGGPKAYLFCLLAVISASLVKDTVLPTSFPMLKWGALFFSFFLILSFAVCTD